MSNTRKCLPGSSSNVFCISAQDDAADDAVVDDAADDVVVDDAADDVVVDDAADDAADAESSAMTAGFAAALLIPIVMAM